MTAGMWLRYFALVLIFYLQQSNALVSRDIVFVVLSQGGTSYHDLQAQHLRKDIQTQARHLSQELPIVHLTHEDFHHPGAWTIFPILHRLDSLHRVNSSWIVFCESFTNFNISKLLNFLSKFDEDKEVWIGHALYDREPTIIHHFAFSDDSAQQLKYPYFASGVAFSKALVAKLAFHMKSKKPTDADFSIDPSHELALFIQNELHGPPLKHSDHFCINKRPHCVSYISSFKICDDAVPKNSIYFAVKTCSKFHKSRIPVVQNTWAEHAEHIGYFSEVEDKSVPTIRVNVKNSEHGHCSKTLAILKHVADLYDSLPQISWVVIVDDDTILSVNRLRQLLSCFRPDKLLALGERYGYNVQFSQHGYNYITGGGGMVFSIDVVMKLVRSGQCICPSNSTPDDMFLGVCLARLGIPITHSPYFHQARPVDYAADYLAAQFPVSFHKHWMVDPVAVYQDWFEDVDKNVHVKDNSHKHIEL